MNDDKCHDFSNQFPLYLLACLSIGIDPWNYNFYRSNKRKRKTKRKFRKIYRKAFAWFKGYSLFDEEFLYESFGKPGLKPSQKQIKNRNKLVQNWMLYNNFDI